MVILSYLNLTPQPMLWSVVMMAPSMHCGTVCGRGLVFHLRRRKRFKCMVGTWCQRRPTWWTCRCSYALGLQPRGETEDWGRRPGQVLV